MQSTFARAVHEQSFLLQSCAENLRRFLEKRGGALGGVSVALMLVEVGAILLSVCLFFAMRQEEKQMP